MTLESTNETAQSISQSARNREITSSTINSTINKTPPASHPTTAKGRTDSKNDSSRPPIATSQTERAFNELVDAIAAEINPHTALHFTLTLTGETSQFTRFNGSKIRQTGQVQDGQIRLTLMTCDRTTALQLPFISDFATDWATTKPALHTLRQELSQLPTDPFVVLPKQASQLQTREVHTGQLLSHQDIASALLGPVKALDFSGLYAGGIAYRGYADSAGKRHWFETPSFTLDYSLFGNRTHQAVKGTFAGQQWNSQQYAQTISASARQLERLARPIKAIPRGAYRTYLAPAAVGDIIDTILWGGGLGEAALRQGNSAFNKLETGDAQLSEKFSLQENFQRIGIPRFNASGEMAPAQLPIIQKGRWMTSLVNDRSEKEYGKLSNAANEEEYMRAPTVAPGSLQEADILSALGTGLYLSNLHYLNWSDLTAGRMTGMTRYACFWVEDGEIVAPIENLRFDDDLYRFLGEGLIDLSAQQTFLPAVGTYDQRSLGGMWMPGMLIDQFRYTL